MKTLDDLRHEIDTIDNEIVSLVSKRMHVVNEIGKLKKENKLEPLDEKRWQEVVERILAKARMLNLSENLIHKIYDEIHQAALKIEKDL